MDCPKCKTNGKPTPMRRDIAIIGGGSSITRQDGLPSDETIIYWTCWSCGTLITIDPEPMPITNQMVHPSCGMLAEVKKENKKTARNNEAPVNLRALLTKHFDTITGWRNIGLSWAKISVQLSKEFGRRLPRRTLCSAWGKLKLEVTDGI